ncbi:hypothetical protein Pmani_000450 [Petrolisthes manimaculis]|uniref:Uncharacterized protein n=1 Tax=Petrolisthes manimaculis TaxID=1843537 RepID=A0AAE1ULC3_9EUCA|nr:hypothetical protein Pmani_000450 [Petrolisthes manimaculis]
MPSADCDTDHRFVKSKVRLSVKVAPKKRGSCTRKLQVDKLHELSEEFRRELEVRLDNNEIPDQDEDPENEWQHLKTILQETTGEVNGFSSRKNKDWFDENDAEVEDLLKTKRSCHAKLLTYPNVQAAKAAYRTACSTLQHKLREIKNNWWLALAERIQSYADMGNTRAFYEALQSVYGPVNQVQAPLRSSDGSGLLTDKYSTPFWVAGLSTMGTFLVTIGTYKSPPSKTYPNRK